MTRRCACDAYTLRQAVFPYANDPWLGSFFLTLDRLQTPDRCSSSQTSSFYPPPRPASADLAGRYRCVALSVSRPQPHSVAQGSCDEWDAERQFSALQRGRSSGGAADGRVGRRRASAPSLNRPRRHGANLRFHLPPAARVRCVAGEGAARDRHDSALAHPVMSQPL